MYSFTVIYTALLNVLHLYFAALPVHTVVEPITTVRTQFIAPRLLCTYISLPKRHILIQLFIFPLSLTLSAISFWEIIC